MASTFPPPPMGTREPRLARPPRRSESASLAEIMADVTSQTAGGPGGAGPRAPASHFFPSVSRAQREQARTARLAASASASPEPPAAAAAPPAPAAAAAAPVFPGKARGIQALLSAAEDDRPFPPVAAAAPATRQVDPAGDVDHHARRQARLELASTGPFDNRRPVPAHAETHAPAGVHEEEEERRGVGAGGSGGTKRRFRDLDRTGWDAASELVMLEREREKALRGWTGAGGEGAQAGGARGKGKGKEVEPAPTPDREKTPTPSMRQALAPPVGIVAPQDDVAMAVDDGPSRSASPDARSSKAPSIASTADVNGDFDDASAMDDDASIMTGMTGATGASAEDDDGAGKEPAKKRSRTLTTPAQTAVLNALLAKTRFPSTETREEVGKQIGMSARRVQIWFQNRRQSQKRQRDREAQEAAAASVADAAAMAAGQHPGYPPHQHLQSYPIDGYNQAAHFYPPLQPKMHHPAMNGGYPPRPDIPRHPSMESLSGRASFAASQHSLHSMHSRDGLAPLASDARYAHPYANGGGAGPYGAYGQPGQPGMFPPPGYPSHLQPHQQQQAPHHPVIPNKLYFPHVPRSHAPPGRLMPDPFRPQPASPTAPAPGAGTDVKLPSLSSVLHSSAPPAQQPPQVHAPISAPVSHQPMFSHSPFSPPAPAHTVPPSSAAPATQAPPSFSRSLLSPEPSSSFERLRISGGPLSPAAIATSSFTAATPFAPTATSSAPATSTDRSSGGSADLLDVAMDTIAYRPAGRALPARQMLPPLRTVLGEPPLDSRRAKKGGHSEADKALLAPIGTNAGAAGGPPRLAPIQTFAPLVSSSSPVSPRSNAAALSPHDAAPAGAQGNSRASTWSDVSHATRSSAASFEFGAPPPGSYRESASERSFALGGGGSARPLPPVPAGEGEGEKGRDRVERGASVGTEGTSATRRTSVSSESGVKA
ncbi:hypothetical protein JCM10450v2_006192 [Rhodotorula kratochvilovae]